MGRALPWMALEQVGRHEHEREELGVGLGDIERALDVALSPARVAEPVARDRADEQRLDEGARVQHGRGAVQHRTEGLLRRTCRRSPSAKQTAACPPCAPLALLVREPGQDQRASAVRPSRSSVSTSHSRICAVRACGVRSRPCSRSAAEAASAPRAALAEREHARARWTRSAVAGSRSGRSSASARSSQACALEAGLPASIGPSIARATQRIGWVDRPRLRRADRLRAPLADRAKERHASVARGGRAPDLDVRESDLARQREPVLQVPAGVVEAVGPELDDAEVHQRHGPGLRAQAHLAQGRLRGPRSACTPLEHGAEVAGGAPATGA